MAAAIQYVWNNITHADFAEINRLGPAGNYYAAFSHIDSSFHLAAILHLYYTT
jgi:hypothetical protein